MTAVIQQCVAPSGAQLWHNISRGNSRRAHITLLQLMTRILLPPHPLFFLLSKCGDRISEMAKEDWKQRPECCYFRCWSRSGGKNWGGKVSLVARGICFLAPLYVKNISSSLKTHCRKSEKETPEIPFNLTLQLLTKLLSSCRYPNLFCLCVDLWSSCEHL